MTFSKRRLDRDAGVVGWPIATIGGTHGIRNEGTRILVPKFRRNVAVWMRCACCVQGLAAVVAADHVRQRVGAAAQSCLARARPLFRLRYGRVHLRQVGSTDGNHPMRRAHMELARFPETSGTDTNANCIEDTRNSF